MNDDLLSKAVRNNSNWCDLICSTHGISTEFLPDVWIAPTKVPLLYPNLITLTPNSLGKEISSIPLEHFSVKDSYNTLDLHDQGFSKLFTSSWIGIENINNNVMQADSWIKVTDEKELEAWENAWGNRTDQKFFLPSLLIEPEVGIYGKKSNDVFVAGFMTFTSDMVASISNVFSKTDIWNEILSLVQTDLPIVGYERDEELVKAINAGFSEIGKLTIWQK